MKETFELLTIYVILLMIDHINDFWLINVPALLNVNIIVVITVIILFNIGLALGLNKEQALNAMANNCAMVLKHATARKCRFLPLEVITRQDFKLRYPELELDTSQDFLHNVPSRDEIGSFVDTVVKFDSFDDDEKVVNEAIDNSFLNSMNTLPIDVEQLEADEEDIEEESSVPVSQKEKNLSRDSIGDDGKEDDEKCEREEEKKEEEEGDASYENTELFMSLSSSSFSSSSSKKRSAPHESEDGDTNKEETTEKEKDDDISNKKSGGQSSIQVEEESEKEDNNDLSGGFGSGDFISFTSEQAVDKVVLSSAAVKKKGVKPLGLNNILDNSITTDPKKKKKIRLR